ncbi:MAG: RluA family pseudouridine synthase [Thermoanaerobaculia bacterium]
MRTTADSARSLLDALAALFPDASRTTLRQMLQTRRVRVNGELEIDAKRALEPRDEIVVLSRAEAVTLPPSLTLLHEDDDVIVVIKANGLLTVPTEREKEETAQALLNEYLRQKGGGHIHVVHRLDRETSGVMIFAKNFKTREALKEKFAEHDIDRVYVAIVEGKMNPPQGTIASNLLERPNLRMESVKRHPNAKAAITHYQTKEVAGPYSLLEVTLETGRKNQIRAHLSEAGHPVIGDAFYGSRVNPLQRLGLHAELLGFTHPTSGKRMRFTAPVPRSFRTLFPAK